MHLESLLLFSSIALVATVTPGPAVLLVTTHSLQHGATRTVFTILGNISGLFLMSLFSVLGVGTLIVYSAAAFTVIKAAGAIYLIYLGVKLWRQGFATAASADTGARHRFHPVKLYSQGLMVALSNPKAIAFTTALFPQFIDHRQPLAPQFGILVLTFMSFSFICLSCYAFLSARTAAGLKNSAAARLVSRLFSSLFIASGIGLGLSS